jgi:hypothetical protein
MDSKITVQRGVRLAVKRPARIADLLAKTLSDMMTGEEWFDVELKTRFCIMFLDSLIDEKNNAKHIIDLDLKTVERLKEIPLTMGIRLLRKDPEKGIKTLVAIILNELIEHQKLSYDERLAFYDAMFANFFPELRPEELAHEK